LAHVSIFMALHLKTSFFDARILRRWKLQSSTQTPQPSSGKTCHTNSSQILRLYMKESAHVLHGIRWLRLLTNSSILCLYLWSLASHLSRYRDVCPRLTLRAESVLSWSLRVLTALRGAKSYGCSLAQAFANCGRWIIFAGFRIGTCKNL
jgi:hypothetical protein